MLSLAYLEIIALSPGDKKIYGYFHILKKPSANNFRLPHRVDFFGASASLVSLLEISLHKRKILFNLVSINEESDCKTSQEPSKL